MNLRNIGAYFWSLLVLAALLPATGVAQGKLSSYDRDRTKFFLTDIADDVRKHYYDPTFHGLNWDAEVREQQKKIDNSESVNEVLSHVAAALDSLNDSHTFFLSPPRPYYHDYGWQAQIIGDRCYVVRVRPQSDGEAKGLKPGDEVLAINGYVPDRSNLWKIEYVFNTLRPQPGLRLNLRDPAGNQRQLDVMAKFIQYKRVLDTPTFDIWDQVREAESRWYLMRARAVEMGDELMIMKLPRFLYSESELNSMMGKARKHRSLILDLRQNPGGAVDTLQQLASNMFDHEVKIGDRVGRESKKPMIIKPGHHPFTGKLVVLVDSKSASAAELFARLVQLENRGTVFGDRSSGSVMEAKHYQYSRGLGTVVFFGASITDADIVMTDGKSLEHTGVVPDEVVLPTATDLASGRDPVLARAAATLGVKLTPEDAGKMFPYEWPK